jgi:hypothetical protein
LADKEEVAQHAQHEREAKEQCREAEKKKPKLGPFDPQCPISKSIPTRPVPYTLSKINNLEYVKLDYFTVRGCREAFAGTSKSVSHDTLTFAQVEDTIAICPLAVLRPSRNIRNNEDLSWVEMLQAKNTMLHFIVKSGVWPVTHAESLATFYVNLELHPRKSLPFGEQALIMYQGHVRCEWFDTFK